MKIGKGKIGKGKEMLSLGMCARRDTDQAVPAAPSGVGDPRAQVCVFSPLSLASVKASPQSAQAIADTNLPVVGTWKKWSTPSGLDMQLMRACAHLVQTRPRTF